MNYKVGDKIKVLVDYYSGCMPNGRGPKIGDILTVVEEHKCTTRGNWIDDRTAEVTQANFYGSTEFALVEVKTKRFAVGDRVISIIDTPNIPEGFIGHVFSVDKGPSWDYMVQGIKDQAVEYFNEEELELLSVGKRETKFNPTLSEIENYNFADTITPQDIAGVSKPDVINSPKHYAVFEQVEAIQVIASSMTQEQFYGYCLGNILKYRLRAGGKDDVMQELGKADRYQGLYTENKHLCKEGK